MMKSLLFFLIIFVFFNISRLEASFSKQDSTLANRLFGEAYQAHNQGDFRVAILKIDSLITFSLEREVWYYGICAGLNWKARFAYSANQLDIYYKVIKELDKQLLFHYDKMGACRDITLIDNKMNLGSYYSKRKSLNEAQDVFEELLANARGKMKLSNKQMTLLLIHLAVVHKEKRNHNLALTYLSKAREYFDTSSKGEIEASYDGIIDNHRAKIYESIGKKDSADYYYQRALNKYETLVLQNKGNRNSLRSAYETYAKFHLSDGKPKIAISLLELSLKSIPKDKYAAQERTYRLLGEAYTKILAYDQAVLFFRKAIETNNRALKNYDLAETYVSLGKHYAEQENYTAALRSYQQALINLDDDFEQTDICLNPTDLKRIFSLKTFLNTLRFKARALAVQPNQLACAWETAQLAIQTVDYINADILSEYDKQLLLEENYDLFELAIKISLAQNNYAGIQYAFRVAEKAKSNSLLAAVRKTQIRDFNVPKDLLDQEEQYRYEIRILEERAYKAQRKGERNGEWETQIAQSYQALERLRKYFQTTHPDYYALRHSKEVDDIASVQARLDEDQVLIEYFIGTESSYVFWCTKDRQMQVLEICTATELSTLTQDFVHAIYVPYIENRAGDVALAALKSKYTKAYADQIYETNAYALYECLIKPVLDQLAPGITRLEIIPDGVLNTLPFDALLQAEIPADRPKEYASSYYQYLARDYEISYCYSATLLRLMKKKTSSELSQDTRLLMFHHLDFENQATAIQNVLASFGLFDSFVHKLDEGSHQENLNRLGSAYKYLHFSVHGEVDNEQPQRSYLQLRSSPNFKDSLLYLSNIYGISLPADLVVTSACNAGVGKLSKGEGLLSLARGFSYSGAKSLLTSLWAIQDGPSNELLETFYAELGRGEPKDKAFAIAKRDFITNYPSKAHPYYWAAFVPIGNMDAIEMPMARWKVYGAGVLVLVVLLCFFLLKSNLDF